MKFRTGGKARERQADLVKFQSRQLQSGGEKQVFDLFAYNPWNFSGVLFLVKILKTLILVWK